MSLFSKRRRDEHAVSVCQSEKFPQNELKRITGVETSRSEDCDTSSKNEFPIKNNALLGQVEDTVKGYQLVLSVKCNDSNEFMGELLAYEGSNKISQLEFNVFSNNNVYIENLHTKEPYRNKGIATTLIKLMHSILFQFCKNQKFYVNAVPYDQCMTENQLENFYKKRGIYHIGNPSDAALMDDDISEEIEKTLEQIRKKLPIIK